MNEKNNSTNRIEYFDYLRIFATFGVILLHVAAEYWYTSDVTSYEWNVLNVYDNISRWTVPIFVMISGSLFLEQNYSVSSMYKKFIFRLVPAFLFWSALYAMINMVQNHLSPVKVIAQMIKGHFHMWFIPMIIGLYIITPFLKKIAESMKLTKYFLIVCFIFSFVMPNITTIISLIDGDLGYSVSQVTGNLYFYFTFGFVGFYVLGYYLNRIDTAHKLKWPLYILGIIGALSTIALTVIFSRRNQAAEGSLCWYLSVNVFLFSMGVFAFAKNNWNHINVSPSVKGIVQKMSKYSFGVYLVHVLVMEQLDILFGINSLAFNPIISVPVISLLIFVISYMISAVLHHIPVLKKYIV